MSILQFITAFVCYHDLKHRSKDKRLGALKTETMGKVVLKILCYYFRDVLKISDFDFDNILLGDMLILKYFELWHFIWKFDWWKSIAN